MLVSSVELVYDEDGNELVGYVWGEKGRLKKYEYSYEHGLMTRKISFDEQTPEWFMYEYNEEGLMIRGVVCLGSSVGLKDEVYETRDYTYDNPGRNIRIDCTQLDGFKYSHEWEYEEDMTIYSIYTGDGTLRWYSVTNKYDGEGNLIGYEEYN